MKSSVKERKSSTPATGQTKILVIDDHPVFRRGMTALIEMEPDLAVCGGAATCQEALRAVAECKPDLIISDISLEEGGDGIALIKDIMRMHPGLPVLVVSMHDEAVYAERAFRAGARGYVDKHEMDQTVIAAIRRLLEGDLWMSDTLTRRFARKFVSNGSVETASAFDALSDRELEVFRRIGRGRTTREIADELHLSVKTIETHRGRIKQKLGLANAAALTRRATQWVEIGDAG